ncbi:hypothetical protein BGZ76_002924 [Entomortierella beljakovae]|nr:hypothetical protein BGZ76_002924 [Entomortierella beljakovae]
MTYSSVHPLEQSSTTTTPSHHAEALLSRARQLSSHAYERTLVSPPSFFAEGEEFNLSPSTTKPPASPFLSPIVNRDSSSLHQHHRASFSEFINDHNRRRSQRLSSLSTASQSALDSSNPVGSQSPSLSSVSTSFSTISDATLLMQNNNNNNKNQKTSSQDLTVEPYKGESPSFRKHDDNKHYAHTASPSVCHTMTPISHPTSSPLPSFPQTSITNSTQLLQPQPYPSEVLSHRKHRSEIIKGERHLVDFLGALRDDDKPLSSLVSQSSSITQDTPKRASQPSRTPFTSTSTYTPQTIYTSTTADPKQEQLKATRKSWVTTIPVSTITSAPIILSVSTSESQQNQYNNNASVDSIQAEQFALKSTPTSTTTSTAAATISTTNSKPTLDPVTTRTDSTNSVGKKLPIIPKATTSLQPPTAPKKEKRTSKIFGKLVPKFLHTSSSSSNSPKPSSASVGAPLETASPTLPNLPESVIAEDDDWHNMKLSLDFKKLPNPSINSNTSELEMPISPVSPMNPGFAVSPKLSPSKLPTIMEPTDVLTESPEQVQEDGVSGFFKVETHTSHVFVEEQVYNVDHSAFYGNDYSPYTIDEDDDDFFLNSVLRKSRPLSTSTSPSITIESRSGRFSERTPSLSTSFSYSSQSSSAAPSPTASSPPSSLRSVPIANYGMDEKRTRLSSAVKEWRRSTNQSTSSNYSMAYLGDSA